MLALENLNTANNRADFTYAYRVSPNADLSGWTKLKGLINCHGTLMACGYLTKYTHSKVDDERAKKCFDDCRSLISAGKLNKERILLLNKNLKIVQKITQDTVEKERERRFRQRSETPRVLAL